MWQQGQAGGVRWPRSQQPRSCPQQGAGGPCSSVLPTPSRPDSSTPECPRAAQRGAKAWECPSVGGVPRRGPQLPARKQRGESFPLAWPSIFQRSQDGLPDDTDEAVWPFSFCPPGPPLGSRPPHRGEGAQVATAQQVQQAGKWLRGEQGGLSPHPLQEQRPGNPPGCARPPDRPDSGRTVGSLR